MTQFYWSRPLDHATSNLHSDVVIIGAGFVGLSTAYWLSEYHPNLKITVIDRAHAGAGASGRNAGFLTKGSATFYKRVHQEWGADKAIGLHQFSRDSLRLVEERILAPTSSIQWAKTQSLTLIQNKTLKERWMDPAFNPQDLDFHWIDSHELPSVLQKKFIGAYKSADEYKLNPVQLLAELKRIVLGRKVSLIEEMSAFELRPLGVLTDVGTIQTQKVVLALNGYFPQFHSSFKDVILPYRAQMLAVELHEEMDTDALHFDSPERVYWSLVNKKTLLIGGKRLLDEANEVGDFEKVSSLVQGGLESYLKDQLQLRFKILRRWSGIMGFTKHELPYMTEIEAPLKAYMLGGFSGHGMGFGFRSGQEMALLMNGNIQQSFFDTFRTAKFKL